MQSLSTLPRAIPLLAPPHARPGLGLGVPTRHQPIYSCCIPSIRGGLARSGTSGQMGNTSRGAQFQDRGGTCGSAGAWAQPAAASVFLSTIIKCVSRKKAMCLMSSCLLPVPGPSPHAQPAPVGKGRGGHGGVPTSMDILQPLWVAKCKQSGRRKVQGLFHEALWQEDGLRGAVLCTLPCTRVSKVIKTLDDLLTLELGFLCCLNYKHKTSAAEQ